MSSPKASQHDQWYFAFLNGISCTYIPLTLTAQRKLRDLKTKISAQSKKNFVLERDVRYLDSRIALLIQNRIALSEVSINIMGNRKSVDWRRGGI